MRNSEFSRARKYKAESEKVATNKQAQYFVKEGKEKSTLSTHKLVIESESYNIFQQI